jgi:hypothetical protein
MIHPTVKTVGFLAPGCNKLNQTRSFGTPTKSTQGSIVGAEKYAHFKLFLLKASTIIDVLSTPAFQ